VSKTQSSSENQLHRDEDWFREQYCDKGKTLEEMAQDAPVSRPTLGRWKNRHGIERTAHVDEPQPDEGEYNEMVEIIDSWIVPPRSHRAALHIYEDCDRLQCQNESLATKPPSVYPHGYTDVCEYCLEEYRS